ncbi:MAG: PhzF family phenazine biosynthesis protein [Balneola sp.]
MKLPIFQVDAFTERIFGGNPAAVCPLDDWLKEETMQQIAAENNLSETAFFVQKGNEYELRWFTPELEVDLCGHATLATAHVLFEHLGYDKDEIHFQTKSGLLIVSKEGERLKMDFPTDDMPKVDPPAVLFQALGVRSDQVFASDDYMVVLDSEEEVKNIAPDFNILSEVNARGIIVTAPGDEVDFVSRFFAPRAGISEDPVTGSAHTKLTPYWSKRLGKKTLGARQISKRVGALMCINKGDRTEIFGKAITYMTGEITI